MYCQQNQIKSVDNNLIKIRSIRDDPGDGGEDWQGQGGVGVGVEVGFLPPPPESL